MSQQNIINKNTYILSPFFLCVSLRSISSLDSFLSQERNRGPVLFVFIIASCNAHTDKKYLVVIFVNKIQITRVFLSPESISLLRCEIIS